jgi:predicted DNA-binding protein
LSIIFPHEFKFFVWHAQAVAKKTLQFNIRMSEEQRAELEAMRLRHGRPLSYQVEHLIALAKLLIEFCDGNDNLEVARERLARAKKRLSKP